LAGRRRGPAEPFDRRRGKAVINGVKKTGGEWSVSEHYRPLRRGESKGIEAPCNTSALLVGGVGAGNGEIWGGDCLVPRLRLKVPVSPKLHVDLL